MLKISLERLGEIHDKDDEEDKMEQYVTDVPKQDIRNKRYVIQVYWL